MLEEKKLKNRFKIGDHAYKAFFEGDFDFDDKNKDKEIIEIDEDDIKEAES